jgi:membrane-associated phospholipid phosphatase
LQPVLAAESDALPDAPSATIRRQWYATQRPDTSGDSSQSGGSTRVGADSNNGKFVARWLKRGLHDQSDIYTSPFHRSELKWAIGLPALSLGLIAIDKHVSGALPSGHTNVSSDISNAGLFTTAGTLGVFLLDGLARHNPHARETGVLGAESMANSGLLYIVLQLITERQRPLQGAGTGGFFQTRGLDNSFPSGHAIVTWAAASAIAHEYPKPWVEWLAYGAAAGVSVTRFTSLQHFPSDVAVGGILGYLIGRHIFHAHCEAGLSRACSAP